MDKKYLVRKDGKHYIDLSMATPDEKVKALHTLYGQISNNNNELVESLDNHYPGQFDSIKYYADNGNRDSKVDLITFFKKNGEYDKAIGTSERLLRETAAKRQELSKVAKEMSRIKE